MTANQIAIITLFPEMFRALDYGITGRALKQQLLKLHFYNPRDFSQDKHRRVDDKPYGGGPGMVMQAQPLRDAIDAAKNTLGPQSKVIYLSPQGQRLTQKMISELQQLDHFILLAGRYEGIDQRVITSHVDQTLSIGDYVLSGGELAAMIMIDALTRLLPDALGDERSAQCDSFSPTINGILDHAHYTRPENIDGLAVPDILLSGDHQAIAHWRLQQSLINTYQNRPDLLENAALTTQQTTLLNEIIARREHHD